MKVKELVLIKTIKNGRSKSVKLPIENKVAVFVTQYKYTLSPETSTSSCSVSSIVKSFGDSIVDNQDVFKDAIENDTFGFMFICFRKITTPRNITQSLSSLVQHKIMENYEPNSLMYKASKNVCVLTLDMVREFIPMPFRSRETFLLK